MIILGGLALNNDPGPHYSAPSIKYQTSDGSRVQPVQFSITQFMHWTALAIILALAASVAGQAPDGEYMGADHAARAVPVFTEASAERFPAFIVDPHNRAFNFWATAIRDGNLPRSGVTLVHFDAHPDLEAPEILFFNSTLPNDPTTLGDAHTTISSFILTAVWYGIIDRVIWIRQPECQQFSRDYPDDYAVTVGLNSVPRPDGQTIYQTDLAEEYYLPDYERAETMLNATTFMLRIMTLEALLNRTGGLGLDIDTPVVLDVDMDFFATNNPVREDVVSVTNATVADALARDWSLSAFCRSEDVDAAVAEQREFARVLIRVMRERKWMADLESFMEAARPVVWQWCDGRGEEALSRLHWTIEHFLISKYTGRALKEAVSGLAGRLQLSANLPCTYPRDAALIKRDLDWFKVAIQRSLGGTESTGPRPRAATIARSVSDQFLSLAAWPSIETSLLSTLVSLYGNVVMTYDRGLTPAPDPADGIAAVRQNEQMSIYQRRLRVLMRAEEERQFDSASEDESDDDMNAALDTEAELDQGANFTMPDVDWDKLFESDGEDEKVPGEVKDPLEDMIYFERKTDNEGSDSEESDL